MKALLNKKVAILLLTVFALAFSLSAVANGPSLGGEDPPYTEAEVRAACEAAYDYQIQVNQCVANVCGHYGCS